MDPRHFLQDGIFTPDELTLLHRVFREVATSRGYAAESIESEHLAIRLFCLFRGGVGEENELLIAARHLPPEARSLHVRDKVDAQA